jgi:hypothetical protein
VATTGAAVTVAISLAGPAAAAPAPRTSDHGCPSTAVCNPGRHLGWENHRNLGG